jgi:hypothetical protein
MDIYFERLMQIETELTLDWDYGHEVAPSNKP